MLSIGGERDRSSDPCGGGGVAFERSFLHVRVWASDGAREIGAGLWAGGGERVEVPPRACEPADRHTTSRLEGLTAGVWS